MSSPAPHVLVVDDDQEIRRLLSRYLIEQGFRVSLAGDLKGLRAELAAHKVDIAVLDIMLPDGSGLDMCRKLRTSNPGLPIILLTALKEDVDKIVGLEMGADDYLGKPFNPRELIARIRSVLRRIDATASSRAPLRRYRFAGFEANPETRSVTDVDGAVLPLTAGEFDLLLAFLERPGRVLSRDQLLDFTQSRDGDAFDRSIDVMVSRLRLKLGDRGTREIFKTIRNGGYQFAVPITIAEKGQ